MQTIPRDERAELVDQLNRGHDLLRIIKDPVHRATIASLVDYLENKLAAMEPGKTASSQ